jgi:hypothetical protein
MNHSPRTLSDSDGRRLFGALLLQPFVAAGVAFGAFRTFLLDANGRALAGGYPSDPTDAGLSVAAGVFLVAAVVTFVGVLPTSVWLMKRRNIRLTEALVVGLGFGILTYTLLAAAAGGRTYGALGVLRGLAFSACIGLVSAAFFWMMALRGRTTE